MRYLSKQKTKLFFFGFPLLMLALLYWNCSEKKKKASNSEAKAIKTEKIKVVFDTDANNELDDQHALAYLLLNGNTFDVDAITVNATYNGGDIQGHYDEALRVLQLCNLENKIPLLKGANGSFDSISKPWNPDAYDGSEAVEYLIEQTKKDSLVIIAVGKLTNIALALKKDPSFALRTKIVWLGSNYPEPGEYNQDNDTIAMNYVLNSDIPFEMVTVRYGKPSGTDAVKVTKEEINHKMPSLGPKANKKVIGRHGGEFENFGDYSISLFDYIDYHGDPPSRALFDMVAVAILKNASWGERKSIPAPILIDNNWRDRPSNTRKITVWESFNKKELLKDFYNTLQNPVPVAN
ncbi:nucleoside hydrolase [Eudoraea chungangensis]|uniref:nucleoside hydrolase n=1 Tax=Eudoraea chungangensis TaxID=1481905 RepID=UPI0023ECD9EE|nr:nucleoside hydrolase [Eudoraea chungangensis]